MTHCCGACMTGARVVLRQKEILMRDVPILCCPACRRVEVHPLVKNILEQVIEKQGENEDLVTEMNVSEVVDSETVEAWQNHGVSFGDVVDAVALLKVQIDRSLELLHISKSLRDAQWTAELNTRLRVLSIHLRREVEHADAAYEGG
ncbi:hypothetical protein [Pasteuria penetrans]|uniref:hypothetical protein n=1 Tax=Pasteuria penetrans TaxID=86005 RepID=UPI000FBA9142|nr:hypothetical protein [Pasteuria penetrans]